MELKERKQKLEIALEKAKKKEEDKKTEIKKRQSFNEPLRLPAEFVSAVFVGAGLGLLIDRWVQTSPFFLCLLLFLGFVTGVWNIVRGVEEKRSNYKKHNQEKS